MTIQTRIKDATVVCATVAAAFLGGAILPTAAPVAGAAGPCLFGHVDPNDDNSACRGSDSARFPESESGPDGTPALSCTRLNEDARVRTDQGAYGWRHWICKKYKDSWGHTYYEWTEILAT
ncbi:hypothetical protein [Nocardia abscessus]|uniref:hypothetical protein n=1 Tax=Nocardia abscessus TaxID=120957 RepID=UPI002456BD36|nr:hypothetical protein [Nocardia abscessus]